MGPPTLRWHVQWAYLDRANQYRVTLKKILLFIFFAENLIFFFYFFFSLRWGVWGDPPQVSILHISAASIGLRRVPRRPKIDGQCPGSATRKMRGCAGIPQVDIGRTFERSRAFGVLRASYGCLPILGITCVQLLGMVLRNLATNHS